ncbi:hypothetical protein H0H81_006584 [Sphagnurus paluster]|uniref:Cytochrome P450 n=1 Tax=Sphagnurus paluster TaxID=117069 RepID=A0A9P7FXF5_9AGAR|nr:hypothetical protein H0H81_006584 [Sphagnurus paluster]
MSPLNTSQSALALVVVLTVYQLLRRFVVKTSLDNIPGPPSNSFIKAVQQGNMRQLFNTNGWEFHHKLGETFGRVALVLGLFGDKQLYISDPKALYYILVKNQDLFDHSEANLTMLSLIFGQSVGSTTGDQHRKLRKMMNPVFSVAHLRDMLPIFYEVTQKIDVAIAKDLSDGPREINILQWMTRAALEMIGQSGLGYSFDSLEDEESENPYTKAVKELFPTILKLRFIQEFLLVPLVKIGSPKFRRACVELLPLKNVQKVKEMTDIMDKTSREIVDSKRQALAKGNEAVQQQVSQGKDVISILMKANLAASERDRLDDTEVLAQLTGLIFGAMDTTSNALSRTLYILAQHPEVQEKLRQEIREAREQYGQIPHDELVALPYLDAICRETLRLYPPLSVVIRSSKKDAVVPLSTPIKGRDGQDINEIAIPKNTDIIISILNCNRDTSLWGSDALEWKPERWLSPLPDAVREARIPGVYSNLMTFIGGGHSCIGFKFSELEMKVVLSVLVDHYRFSPSKEEIIWQMGNISIPTVKGEPGKPVLPIKMDLVV